MGFNETQFYDIYLNFKVIKVLTKKRFHELMLINPLMREHLSLTCDKKLHYYLEKTNEIIK